MNDEILTEMNLHLRNSVKLYLIEVLSSFNISIDGIKILMSENLMTSMNINTASFFYGCKSITFYGQLNETEMGNDSLRDYLVKNNLAHVVPKATFQKFTNAPWATCSNPFEKIVREIGEFIGADNHLLAMLTIIAISSDTLDGLSSSDVVLLKYMSEYVRTLLNRYFKNKIGIKKSAIRISNFKTSLNQLKHMLQNI